MPLTKLSFFPLPHEFDRLDQYEKVYIYSDLRDWASLRKSMVDELLTEKYKNWPLDK